MSALWCFKRIWPFDDEPGVPADRVVGAEQKQGRRPGGRVRLLMVVVMVMVVGPWSPHAGGCTRRPDAVTSRGRRDFLLRRQPLIKIVNLSILKIIKKIIVKT